MKKDYKKLCPFKGWVLENFPFIEADFDAITNYELLCKIVEYLNKTSSQFNDMIDNINYLNSWFENLDVQEEINNKLDEMVEAGTLQEIIADYLNSKAIFGFDTVAEMKNATNLIDGSYAKTLGYHAKNDGGMATYKIRTITNDDVVNEMDIIALNDDSLIAELIYENPLKPEQFGAYGNGTTDDTIPVQYALNHSNNVLMDKIYKVSEIVLTQNDQTLTFNQIIGKIKVNATQMIQFLKINGKRLTNESGIGLHLVSHGNIGIQYCRFSIGLIRADECIKLDSSDGGWINNNYFEETNVSYHTGITTVALTNKYYNGNIFNKIGFEGLTKWFTINNFQETKFNDCRMIPFEADGSSAIHELGTLNNSRNVTFENNSNGTYWEMINCSNNSRFIKFFNKVMSAGGTVDATYLKTYDGVADTIKSPCQQLVLDIGSLSSGTFPVQIYEYDLTKTIILDFTNGSRYMYMNLNIPANLINAFKVVTVQIIGTTANEVDLRIRNQNFKVIPTGTADKTFTLLLPNS